MAKVVKKSTILIFERIKQVGENGVEYWTARQMADVLMYGQYKIFRPVTEVAKEACKNSGQAIENHFVEFYGMIHVRSGAVEKVDDVKLSRYACYLIVQNAGPDKEGIALGRNYFAVQTHLQKIQQMEEYGRLNTGNEQMLFVRNEMKVHNIQLAEEESLIDLVDYAMFQNYGYQGLCGRLNTKDTH